MSKVSNPAESVEPAEPYEVFYYHYRVGENGGLWRYCHNDRETGNKWRGGWNQGEPRPRGGATICVLRPASTGAYGFYDPIVRVAVCSNKDQFNYKLGRTIAHGRAVDAFNTSVPQPSDVQARLVCAELGFDPVANEDEPGIVPSLFVHPFNITYA